MSEQDSCCWERMSSAVDFEVLSGLRSGSRNRKGGKNGKSFSKPAPSFYNGKLRCGVDQNGNTTTMTTTTTTTRRAKGSSTPTSCSGTWSTTSSAGSVADLLLIESEDEVKSESGATTSSTTSEDADPLMMMMMGEVAGDEGGGSGKKKRRSTRYDSSESSSDRVMTTSFSSGISSFDESDSVSNFSIKSDVSESGISVKSTSSFTDSSIICSQTSSCSSSSSSSINNFRGAATSAGTLSTPNLKFGSKCSRSSEVEPVVTDGSRCLWQDCSTELDGNLNVLEHIQNVHVVPQITIDNGYICRWEGCKVFNKKSCSLSWLERHVLSHGGNKPLKCIFPGCGLSFGSQIALQRHVNSHISNTACTGGANANGSLSSRKYESSPSKLAAARRKKLKALRRHSQPWGQKPDYVDLGVMEKIKFQLLSSHTEQQERHLPPQPKYQGLTLKEEAFPEEIVFEAEILASRSSGILAEAEVLVQYHPRFVLSDQWIPKSKYEATKTVPIRQIDSTRLSIHNPDFSKRPPRAPRKARKSPPTFNSIITS